MLLPLLLFHRSQKFKLIILRAFISYLCVQGVMMMTAGFFRFFQDLPKPFWRYPISYINYMGWALEVKSTGLMTGIEHQNRKEKRLALHIFSRSQLNHENSTSI